MTADRVAALGASETPLGLLAIVLARALDVGAGLSTAAISRELRATLSDLEGTQDDDDGLSGVLTRVRVAAVRDRTIG